MKEVLEFKNLSKSFSGNSVLKDVSFKINEGEIIGLVGENGAGKSTMMNILFGMSFIEATGGYEGDILLDGNVVKFTSPEQALKAGIGMVHQEFSLIPGFEATENILLNREILKDNFLSRKIYKKLALLERGKMQNKAEETVSILGVDIPVQTIVGDMPVGHKQFIEISRELSKDNIRVIIMDEPTAVLTESEADILLQAIKKLSERGISFIFISHRLKEVQEVCDRIVVLRDGEIVENAVNDNITVTQIANWMVGRKVDSENLPFKTKVISDEVVMKINNLFVDMPGETVRNVSLEVRKGEILGLAGLAGQGKIGIPNGIMGLYPAGGEVIYKDKLLNINNPKEVLESNIAFVSEDRRGMGLLLDEGIDWNICFNAMQIQDKFLKKVGPFSFRDEKEMDRVANTYIQDLEIRCQGPKEKVKNLSGGNQQKVCLAKAFAVDPEFLFVSEPTRGIDIGAKQLVLDSLLEYNEKHGTTIVIVSSELEELRSISDRIAVIYKGEVFDILEPDAPVEDFGLMMAGISLEEAKKDE